MYLVMERDVMVVGRHRQDQTGGQLPAGQLGCPLLIVHGSADARVPVGQARRLATAVPGAQLYEVPGASHLVPLSSHATEADQRISGFLHQHAPHQ